MQKLTKDVFEEFPEEYMKCYAREIIRITEEMQQRKGGTAVKEMYANAAEAARDLGVEPKLIRFIMQKNIVKSGAVVPKAKKNGKNKYIIFTRKLCEEIGIPFVEEVRHEETDN